MHKRYKLTFYGRDQFFSDLSELGVTMLVIFEMLKTYDSDVSDEGVVVVQNKFALWIIYSCYIKKLCRAEQVIEVFEKNLGNVRTESVEN